MGDDEQSGAHDDDLDELLESVLDAADDSGALAARERLDALCAEHPRHADALRRRARLLEELGVLTPIPSAASGASGLDPSGAPAHHQLGAFRLERVLGAGGMGVVHLAFQEDLGRRVAVKVIRPEHLFFPGARERFRREVETVARLQHPGIVPIYTVGEDGGVPYFAMEYLEGASLADALDALRARDADAAHLRGRDLAEAVARGASDAGDESDSGDAWLFAGSWEATALRVVRQVAEALDHAHRRGVVHRDIKPSNVMITHGEDGGRVKLLDFGLARIETDGASAQGITRSGSRLGSLPYMAPEQVRGDLASIDARTDVYGLGVVLFELLTLRRPFEETGEAGLLAAIEGGAPPRPRSLAPSISWEAETVCLAAMDVDPSRRYRSAADFARDLDNALRGRPLEARRVGLARRARRWVAHNPAVATAAALALVLVVGVPWLFVAQARRNEEAVREQLVRADAHFARSLDAIDRMLTRVGSEDLAFVPQVEPLREALLEDAVALVEQTLAQEVDDPGAIARAADGHERLGRLRTELGRIDLALADFDRALELHDRRMSAAPDDPARRAARASVVANRAVALATAGRFDEAEPAFRAADDVLAASQADLAERGHADDALDLALRRAQNLVQLGELLLGRLGPEDETRDSPGMDVWERAIALFEHVTDARPDDAEALAQLGELCTATAQVLLRPPAPPRPRDDEHAWLDRADAALARATDLAPDDPTVTFRALVVELVRAKAAKAEARFDDAETLVRDTLPGLRELVRRFPSTPEYHVELATALNEVGVLYDWRERPEEMVTWYARAVEELRDLLERYPLIADLHSRTASGEMNTGVAHLNLGENARAEEHLRRAVAAQRRAIELAPDNGRYPNLLRYHHMAHSDALLRLGRVDDAADAADEMPRVVPDDWEASTQAASRIAQIIGSLGTAPQLDPDGSRAAALAERAVAHLRRAIDGGFPDPTEIATAPPLRPLHGHASFEALVAELVDP